MKFYNVCTKETYARKDGEQKSTWPPVGRLGVMDDGKMFLTLNMFPGTKFYVFEQERKDKPRASTSGGGNPAQEAFPDDDVPFISNGGSW